MSIQRHHMSQITTKAAPGFVSQRRRRKAIVVGVTALVGAAALLGVGACGSADGPGLWRSEGMVHIEPQDLDVIYQGQRISPELLQSLNDRGKGLFTATDVDTATDLHATRAFDTEAELNAYSAAYAAWLRDEREHHDDVPPWGIVAPEVWSPAKE